MSSEITFLVILGVLTIAGVWLITEIIQAVCELRRRGLEEDEE